ncbi:MAG: hypothetical protein P1U81_04875 [Verrucomicrobiales bacterium]|nr:hypothetical protein [Verrucomicrobiales bacterium]
MKNPVTPFRRFFAILPGLFAAGILYGEEDLTPRVLSLFQEKCQECHHPDTNDDFPYLHEAVSIEDLISDEAIVPGKPGESVILERALLEADSRKRMPKSRGAEGDDSYRPPLTPEETGLLSRWIAQLEAKPAPELTSTESVSGTPEPIEVTVSVSDNPDEMPNGVSLDEKVHWIFEQRCAKCHSGDYEPELHGTINLAVLFSEKDADGKTLLAETIAERILRDHDSEGRMPKSKGGPGDKSFRPPLMDPEKEVIRKWVEAGKPKQIERRLITNAEVVGTIYEDLRSAGESERRFFRYLTLTNLHNGKDSEGNALVPDLDPHRAAVSKLMNSLSMNAKIMRPTAIDEAQTIYRIDLRDYHWYPEDWDEVVQYYPYGILGIDRQKEQLIERYTGSAMAYLRADWFTFAAAQPPLYDDIMYRLLGIESDRDDDNVLQMLEEALGVDRIGNLREGNAMRAGFQFSGVSEANRLIERHELGAYQGAYWVSYDFTPLSPKRTQELKLAPLGPMDAGLTDDEDHIFEHDGGEMIYNLPNGLQGYMLTTQDGHRLDRGPIEIVQDDNRQDNVILNGISCMACHDQGIKPAIRVTDPSKRTLEGMTDEIGPLVSAAGILDFEEQNLLEKLYVEPEVLQAAVKKDFERFTRAEAEATGGMAGSTEPVVGLYNEFRSPVTVRKLASEFGMDLEELMKLMEEESHQSETLSVIASSMARDLPVRRENLLREYIAVVYALGYELMPFVPLGYEDFGGEKYATLIADSDQYHAAFGDGAHSITTTKKALLTSKESAETLAQESVLLPDGGKLKISIQPNLKVGDRAELDIVATADAHIRVFHFSSDEHVTELFPGNSDRATLRPKNKKLRVSWETTAPGGAEHIIVYAAKSEISNLAHGQKAGDFVLFQKDDVYSARGIPKAIKVTEIVDVTGAPAKIVQARIGYFLKD